MHLDQRCWAGVVGCTPSSGSILLRHWCSYLGRLLSRTGVAATTCSEWARKRIPLLLWPHLRIPRLPKEKEGSQGALHTCGQARHDIKRTALHLAVVDDLQALHNGSALPSGPPARGLLLLPPALFAAHGGQNADGARHLQPAHGSDLGRGPGPLPWALWKQPHSPKQEQVFNLPQSAAREISVEPCLSGRCHRHGSSQPDNSFSRGWHLRGARAAR